MATNYVQLFSAISYEIATFEKVAFRFACWHQDFRSDSDSNRVLSEEFPKFVNFSHIFKF